MSLATPTATIPVTLSAEDDYGIASVQLFRSLNDSRPLPMSPRLAAAVSRRLSTTVELPLAAYGLEPGDVIKLFARVEDNDPAGGKGSESPVVVLNIVSQQDFDRMLRRALQPGNAACRNMSRPSDDWMPGGKSTRACEKAKRTWGQAGQRRRSQGARKAGPAFEARRSRAAQGGGRSLALRHRPQADRAADQDGQGHGRSIAQGWSAIASAKSSRLPSSTRS